MASKQPWEMTREEYAAYLAEHEDRTRRSYLANYTADLQQARRLLERATTDADLDEARRNVARFEFLVKRYSAANALTAADIEVARIQDIQTAIEDGDEIPAHVRADYPQLFRAE